MASTASALTIVERVEQSAVVAALESKTTALADLLPDEAAVSRFKRGVIVAITKNPDLMNCTPDSIVMACFEAASQGLEPTGAAGGAHLVPYKMKDGTRVAQLIPDYRGVIRMVTKPGSEVLSIEARVVKEGDEFTYQLGTDAFVNHVPALEAGRSAKATTHVYAIARLKSGAAIPDVEDRAGVERIQNRGGAKTGQSPWATDWDEMAKKTLIKRLAKVLPVRPDVRQILVREDELDGDTDADPGPLQPKGPNAAARLASRLAPKNVTRAEAPAAEAEAAAETGAADDAGGDPAEVAPGLTKAELVAALGELNVSLDYAVEAAKTLWPDRGSAELTPEQRHELVESLRSEAAQAAL